MMRRIWLFLLSGVVVVITAAGLFLSVGGSGVAERAGRGAAEVQAVASPSPSLGSTPQPGVNPPGDADADADDFGQAPLILIAFGILVVLVAGGVLFYRRRQKQ
jgi:LPXTG-motif cell wall-anchored protein